jgi:hypothetical protein
VSDVNLLAFGCAVSFIAAAGAYVFVRERFTLRQEQEKARSSGGEPVGAGLRDVA